MVFRVFAFAIPRFNGYLTVKRAKRNGLLFLRVILGYMPMYWVAKRLIMRNSTCNNLLHFFLNTVRYIEQYLHILHDFS